MRKNIRKTCRYCLKVFASGRSSQQYCNQLCYRDKRKIDEVFIVGNPSSRNKNLKKYWWCRVSPLGSRFGKNFKRKDTLLLAESLGRELTNSEVFRIVYLDGDTNNCCLENLTIRPSAKAVVWVCSVCAKAKTLRAFNIRDKKSNLCRECMDVSKKQGIKSVEGVWTRIAIGTEKIKRNHNTGEQEIFVKVGDKSNGQPSWRLKRCLKIGELGCRKRGRTG